ncbi:MAG TPA: tetratricopeptide repeat protein [Nevskiaceae bacterium]|nr:tetratricopeptide repeat protein [Nevskiaceae bacterium]
MRRVPEPALRLATLPLLAAALFASGCASTPQAVKEAAPSIRSQVGKQEQPAVEELPIIRSEPIAPDASKALENYRKLLELAPDEETRAEARRRMADLQVQVDDFKGGDENSETTVGSSIQIYRELLAERPQDPNNDRVLYQLARAHQNIGQTEQAIEVLARLSREFPESSYTGDGHFRRAELLFQTARYAEAEAEYQIVMDLGDRTSFFEPAQYKFGWSQYKQSRYDAAITTFFQILDRELPPGELTDVASALQGVAKGKGDLAKDSLRVVSLSLAALGGGVAANEYMAKYGDPRFYPLVYNALGEQLQERRRYTDAAEAFAAFTQRYPRHGEAPAFQSRTIAAYAEGGFNELVIREKQRYAETYDPAAAYWAGAPASEAVMAELRLHLEDLARHEHALAQREKRGEAFLTAARWYRRIIELYPRDPRLAEINFLLGDALLDGGRTLEAAQEYAKTAYTYAPHPKSGEAAFAAYLAHQKHAKEVPAAERPAALREAVASGIRLADTFKEHSRKLPVLTQSAQDLYELRDMEQAIGVAARVLAADKPAPEALRRTAWSVTGDAQFELQRYGEAEKAFGEELKLTPAEDPNRPAVIEQLAASIYKQAEAARAAGDLRLAVNTFLRVGEVTPTSSIRANADYDAAASLIELKDWPQAAQVLEGFRRRFPQQALIPDVDKKLAQVYDEDRKPAQAAGAYARIARRASETVEIRREAAWLTAQRYDQAELPREAAEAWEFFVGQFPRPVDRAMQGRSRLVELARSRGDQAGQLRWLREIVRADQAAGAERSEATRSLAATSSLEIGRVTGAEAKRLTLSAPIERSLAAKKQAMETAIQALNQAAGYGFAPVTTAATFELGQLYQDFAQALLASERPRNLDALASEQYDLLLEEQAYPFEEQAIAAYETNLKRIPQGVYDRWVKQSYEALVALAPGRYGKRELREELYESLR